MKRAPKVELVVGVDIDPQEESLERLAHEVFILVRDHNIVKRNKRRRKTAQKLIRTASQKANWLNQALAWHSRVI